MTQMFRAGMVGASPLRAGRPGGAGPGRPQRETATGLLDGLISNIQDAFDTFQYFIPFSAPSSAAAAVGTFTESRYAGPAGSRAYKLYVPACAEAGVALPLVVMLHGCNQSPDDFAAGTRMNEWAEQDGFLVCYPAQTSAANGQRCWNWFKEGDQRRDRGEPAVVAGITREMMARHPVDPDRVYVAGLSAGGALAATMGQRYPDLYAAVGVHSGLACGAARDVGSALAAMRAGAGPDAVEAGATAVPTVVFHGDRDGTVNAVNADEVAAQAMHAADVRAEDRRGAVPGGHDYAVTRFVGPDGRALVERWLVRGAGHAWSGGTSSAAYTDPQGPDASGEMLRFFAEHVGAAGAR